MADYSGGLFYQTGPNFNYLKYLEEKSHFDRLQMSVSSDVRSLVASNEYLADQNIKAVHQASEEITGAIGQQTEQLGAKLDAGFDKLSFDIGEVRQSVDRLATICETGFSEISLQIGQLNEGIHQLIEIAKNKDQTWAFEQFEIARDTFRRRLFGESLDYIDRAISGHGHRPGYKLEHRFHYLRGLIHLGNEQNFDPEIVDPVAAIEDFKASARYAEHVDNEGVARALQMAGWASYCAGDLTQSEKFLREALRYSEDNLHTNFLLGKTLLRQGQTGEAKPFFVKAMHGDIHYALRAGADPDYLRHKDTLESWIEEYRQNLIGECNLVCADLNLSDLRRKWPILVKHGLEPGASKIDELEKQIAEVGHAPLSRLLVLTSSLKSLKDGCVSALSSAKDRLNSKAASLANSKIANTTGEGTNSAIGVGSGFIAAVATFVISMAVFLSEASSEVDMFFALTLGVVIAGIFAVIAAVVATPIMAILSAIFHSVSHAQKSAVHRSQSMSEREKILADLHKLET